MNVTGNTRQLNPETLGVEVLDAMLYEVDKIPEWSAQPQHRREESRERLKVAAEKLVRAAVLCIVGESFPALPATLAGITFGDGIKATLKLSKEDPSRHELADAVGTSVIIVIGQPESYIQRMDLVKQDPQQQLFAGIGETDGEIRESVANQSAQPDPDTPCMNCSHPWGWHVDTTRWEHGQPTACQCYPDSPAEGPKCPCERFIPIEATKPDAEPQTSTVVDLDKFYAQLCTCRHTRERHPLQADGQTDQCVVLGCGCGKFELDPGQIDVTTLLDGPAFVPGAEPKPKTKAEKSAASDAANMQMADITIVLAGTLAQIDIMVDQPTVERMTEEQRRAAYAYAARKQAYPQTRLPRPFFLPEPTLQA